MRTIMKAELDKSWCQSGGKPDALRPINLNSFGASKYQRVHTTKNNRFQSDT